MTMHKKHSQRKGIILLVVVTLLTLFAVVGISFVLYANSAADSARISRETQDGGHTGVEPGLAITNRGGADAPPIPNEIWNNALGQFIYDVSDDTGRYSALRGWGLARDMYGWDPTAFTTTAPIRNLNSKAFSGLGIPEGMVFGNGAGRATDQEPTQRDDPDRSYNYVNYTPSSRTADWAAGNDTAPFPLRDPEWYENRASAGAASTTTRVLPNGAANGNARYVPKNAPYTSFDNNHLFLGAIQASTGEVVTPSFYRPWHFEYRQGNILYSGVQPEHTANGVTVRPVFDARNPLWGNQALANPAQAANSPIYAKGRYRILRPTNYDHPNFPAMPYNQDGTLTGDVTNLEGKAVPRHDSIWMDIDLPVRKWRGRNYKPLVAMLVTDLDGRINTNVAGSVIEARRPNSSGGGFTSIYKQRSNQGWGPWEMNLAIALGDPDPQDLNTTPLPGNPNAHIGDAYKNEAAAILMRLNPSEEGRGERVRMPDNRPMSSMPAPNPTNNPVGPAVDASFQGLYTGMAYGYDTVLSPLGGGLYAYPSARNFSESNFPLVTYANADYDALDRQNFVFPTASAKRYYLPAGRKTTTDSITPASDPMYPLSQFSGPQVWNLDNTGKVDPAFDELILHPGLHNPYLTAYVTPQNWMIDRSQRVADLRWLNFKYRGETDVQSVADLARRAPNTLGNAANPAARFRVTPLSNDLLTPGIQVYEWASLPEHAFRVPPALPQPVTTAVAPPPGFEPHRPLGGGRLFQFMVNGEVSASGGSPSTYAKNPIGSLQPNLFPDFAAANLINSVPGSDVASGTKAMAANLLLGSSGSNILSSLDLNRALLPYPSETNPPPAGYQAIRDIAFQERQIFARDIFLRLAHASGLMPNPPSVASFNAASGPQLLGPATVPSFNTDPLVIPTLRYLAQLSANIVDYIDADDQMTIFNWRNMNPLDPNYLTPDPANTQPLNRKTEIVLGVENPRLVINEVYSQLRNDPADPLMDAMNQPRATMPYKMQTYIEFKNPLTMKNKPATPAAPGPVKDLRQLFQAEMKHYRLLRVKVKDENELRPLLGALESYNREDFDLNPTYFTGVNVNAANVTEISFAAAMQTALADENSFVIVGPPAVAADTSAGKVATINVTIPEPLMEETIPFDQVVQGTGVPHRYVFILQRKSQAPQATTVDPTRNPWATVDYFVQIKDGATWNFGNNSDYVYDNRRFDQMGGNELNANPPLAQQASLGRRQPLDGFQKSQYMYASTTAPATTIRRSVEPQNQAGDAVMSTFGKPNAPAPQRIQLTAPGGAPYTNTNYDWYVHLDRQLISPIELFSVCAFPNHRVSHQFHWNNNGSLPPISDPPTATPPPYNSLADNPFTTRQRMMHLADWNNCEQLTGDALATASLQVGSSDPTDTVYMRVADKARLFRALALLETKTRIHGLPFGGRIPGKVNVNTIMDQEVWSAVASRSPANTFTDAHVAAAWLKILQARHPGDNSVMPGFNAAGTANTPAGVPSRRDRPIMPPGVPIYAPHPNDNSLASSTNPVARNFFFRRGSGIGDTLLRESLFDYTNPSAPAAVATIDAAPTGDPQIPQRPDVEYKAHPYLKNELLNKVYNSLTTRSNTFAVWTTIGYFEVENDGPYTPFNRPRLGRELGSIDGTQVRHRFFAVVDRTNLAIDGANPSRQGQPPILLDFQPFRPRNDNPHVTRTVQAGPNQLTFYEYIFTIPAYMKPDFKTGGDVTNVTDTVIGGNRNVISTLSGDYDGRTWNLTQGIAPDAGSRIVIGAGTANEETVLIGRTTAFGTPQPLLTGFLHGGQASPAANFHSAPFQLTIRTRNYHFPGEFVSMLPAGATVLPYFGNPGPQPQFNYQAEPYNQVVRFATQVK